MKLIFRIFIGLFGFIIIAMNTSATSPDLQELIDATKDGETLYLAKGKYKGNALIQKDITIEAEDGVVIFTNNAQEPLITIENAKNISIKGMSMNTSGTAIKIKNGQNIDLSHLNLSNVSSGIEVYASNNVDFDHISINGTKSGNGISAYNSHSIQVSNNTINEVQDGVYMEEVEDIEVHNNVVENSRYGTHFMYSKQAEVTNNHFTKNVTGLMVMMTSDINIQNNDFSYQDGFNGTGVTLYDVQTANLNHNNISGNRIGLTIQKTAQVEASSNTFQMNQTAMESVKSEDGKAFENLFVGNLVNCRTDALGIHLENNYYDDYSGIDLDGDGFGDETYVALQSFGQWMVRKPVYQYYAEHPSVVLLNQIDKQTNKANQNFLVDITPKVNANFTKGLTFNLDYLQLLVGILLLATCAILFVRTKKST